MSMETLNVDFEPCSNLSLKVDTSQAPATPVSESKDYVEDMLILIKGKDAANMINSTLLTSLEVESDPVLSSLASKQAHDSLSCAAIKSSFKAKPVPNFKDNVGPKMTKAAALRLGLNWEDVKPRRETKSREETKGTPGYKRTGLDINVPSLAAPTIAPRQTKASQLRMGGPLSTPTSVRDRKAIAAANEARADAEKARRRRSIVLPASLASPLITPRLNKSSMLRTGIKSPEPASGIYPLVRTMSNLGVVDSPRRECVQDDCNTAEVSGTNSDKKTAVQPVKSLGTPSIAPRLNRTALLRAPHSSHASISHPSSPVTPLKSVPTRSRPASVATTKFLKSSDSVNRIAPSVGPKSTKSSLLRAAQGAQVSRALSSGA
ncbi:uncharacterized protein L203_104572 [Cryptococcus depauperatus CBS 7841]|uniref:Uncharacterized protein n=1 Tax=Cryptococcus depauperatus CBS 7841 TaxID=1295531 RepID=A0A1E3INK0_9TREE|nr:hypothetical protein L203_02227 [Cryptococcus depauperatus CBS 7841]